MELPINLTMSMLHIHTQNREQGCKPAFAHPRSEQHCSQELKCGNNPRAHQLTHGQEKRGIRKEWTRKMWHPQPMGYYLVIKKKKILTGYSMDGH